MLNNGSRGCPAPDRMVCHLMSLVGPVRLSTASTAMLLTRRITLWKVGLLGAMLFSVAACSSQHDDDRPCPEGEQLEPLQELQRTDNNYTLFDQCAKSSDGGEGDCYGLCSDELARRYAPKRVDVKSCKRVEGDWNPNVSVNVYVDAKVYPVCYGY